MCVAYLNAYSMKTLIVASHHVRAQQEANGVPALATDGTIRRIAAATFGPLGVAFSDFILITAQLSAAAAFVEFIGSAWANVLGVGLGEVWCHPPPH